MIPRVRLIDIAQALRLDKSTVSLALRGDGRVSPETRDRVLHKATEMGYCRDASLEVLASWRWRQRSGQALPNLAFIHSAPGALPGMTGKLISSAKARALGLSLGLDVFYLSETGGTNRLLEVLRSRGIRGLILGPIVGLNDWHGFPWERFVVVNCLGSIGLPPLRSATEAVFTDWCTAHDLMLAKGHRRIGLAVGSCPWSPIGDRKIAVAMYLSGGNGANRDRIRPHLQGRTERIGTWFRRHRPEVVIGSQAEIAHSLEASGILTGVDYEFVNMSLPQIGGEQAGMVGNCSWIGQCAVDWVVRLMRRNEYGLSSIPEVLEIPGSWWPGRQSVGLSQTAYL